MQTSTRPPTSRSIAPTASRKKTGTDRGGYATLVTSYFKSAVSTAMEARGYKYSVGKPDLRVNFYMNTRKRTEIRPGFDSGYGYYGCRRGLYGVWYDDRTINYHVGTINVDIVDAETKQLIWEGVSEGRVSEEALANPKVTINAVITEMMRQSRQAEHVTNAEASVIPA